MRSETRTPGAASSADGGEQTTGEMLERLVDRMFLRALQIMLAGVLVGILFFPVRGRGSAQDLAIAAALLVLTAAALIYRHSVLVRLRKRPVLTLLFPLPAVIAVALDGGVDSIWTPLV